VLAEGHKAGLLVERHKEGVWQRDIKRSVGSEK
jgi:hypothetical protein